MASASNKIEILANILLKSNSLLTKLRTYGITEDEMAKLGQYSTATQKVGRNRHRARVNCLPKSPWFRSILILSFLNIFISFFVLLIRGYPLLFGLGVGGGD